MILWGACLLAAAGAGATEPVGFSGLEIYLAHESARSLTAADFDSNGLRDFAFIHPGRSRVDLFLQKTAEESARDARRPPRYDDLNQIHDDARFAKHTIPLDRPAFALCAADFDGHAGVELAVLSDPAHVAVWARRGDSWRRVWEAELDSREATPSPAALAAADFNGDGRNDLAVLRKSGTAIFFGEPGGVLSAAPVEFPTTMADPVVVSSADVDGDGRSDLVLARFGQDQGIAIRLQRSGTLGWEYVLRTGALIAISLADVDGEAGAEILGIQQTTGRLVAWRFRPAEEQEPAFRDPIALVGIPRRRERGFAVGDVNGEGRDDVVLSDPERATLEVYLQSEGDVLLSPRTFSTYAGVTEVHVAGGAVYVVSPAERAVGASRWEEDRLPLPEPAVDIRGTPRCAAIGEFGLAVAYEEERGWKLAVGDTVRDLPRLPEGPARLLATDIDGDGRTDLVVTQRRDPMLIVRAPVEQGADWTVLTGDYYGATGLVSGAPEETFMPVEGGLLFAKQNFARIVALGSGRRLEVREQIPGPAGARITRAVRMPGGDVLLYNSERGQERLLVLTREDGSWRQCGALVAGGIAPRAMAVGDISGDGEADLVLLGEQAFGVVRRSRVRMELETLRAYESGSRDPRLARVAVADANSDGRPDVVCYDAANRTLEVVVIEPGGPRRALAFEMFEAQEGMLVPGPREFLAADLTGDGKDDLLFLIHDRALLYVQE